MPPVRVGKSLNGAILEIAAPSLVALSLDPLLTFVDTAFVGNLAEPSAGLAAMGVSGAILGVVYPSLSFFTNAATPLVSKLASSEGPASARALATKIASAGLLLGLILCVVLEMIAPTLVGEFDALGSLSFLRIRALSAPAVVAASALTGSLRGLGDATAPLYAAIFASIVNLVIDAVFVPTYGADAAAVATAAAETVGAAYLAVVFYSSSSSETNDESILTKDEDMSLKPFVESAALTLARTLVLQVFLAAVTMTVSTAGAEALAANHVLRSAYSLLSFATDALAVAAQTLVAAAPSSKAKKDVCSGLFAWGAAAGLLFGTGLYFGADLLATLSAGQGAVSQMAAAEMQNTLAPLQLLSSLVFVADGVLQGATAFKYEAAAMVFSVLVAFAFLTLTVLPTASPAETLHQAWFAVAVLQATRFTTFGAWWLFFFDSDQDGPTGLESASLLRASQKNSNQKQQPK